jgi:hypothetical protein
MSEPRRKKSDLHEDYSGPKWAWKIIWKVINQAENGKFVPSKKLCDDIALANMSIEFTGEENE